MTLYLLLTIMLSGLFGGTSAYALCRKGWRLLAVVGPGLLPGLLIIGYFFYLESQAPVGPYHAVVGLIFGIPSLITGLVGALVTVLIAAQLLDETDGETAP